jgi:hypothetical protein
VKVVIALEFAFNNEAYRWRTYAKPDVWVVAKWFRAEVAETVSGSLQLSSMC